MNCPICGKDLINEVCPSCGYDRTIDREEFPTLCRIAGKEPAKSARIAENRMPKHKCNSFANVEVGSKISFGSYWQDKDQTKGKEAIEWRVLAKEAHRILVISERALDCKPYTNTDETWEKCSLRQWLNSTFLNDAFSTEEQTQILSTTVSADKNPKYSTNPGNATTDKVFLLSITEAEKYFTSDEGGMCVPTAYAIAQGADTSDSYKQAGVTTCWWWLRSPGVFQISVACVSDDGSVSYSGGLVGDDRFCVRPALWIKIDSEQVKTRSGADNNKNGEEKLQIGRAKQKCNPFANVEVGSKISFGSYWQDKDQTKGKEAIEWRVLAKKWNKILVISEKALDTKQYNTSFSDVTWRECALRKWLNSTFLNNAFNLEEQAQILNKRVSADKNPQYKTRPGIFTTDKVFFLSITEAEKYFSSDEDRMCVPTAYAKAQGAWTSDDYKKDGAATCWWWLRSPGGYQDTAARVGLDGSVGYDGRHVHSGVACVRPALWINLDS